MCCSLNPSQSKYPGQCPSIAPQAILTCPGIPALLTSVIQVINLIPLWCVALSVLTSEPNWGRGGGIHPEGNGKNWSWHCEQDDWTMAPQGSTCSCSHCLQASMHSAMPHVLHCWVQQSLCYRCSCPKSHDNNLFRDSSMV